MPSAIHNAMLSSGILPVIASTHVITVGDSLTYGQDAVSSAWPLEFASLTGETVQNPSRPGWTSFAMAIKVGAVDVALTFPGNSIPASGTVTLSSVAPDTGYRTTIALTYTGVVSGVNGTLVRAADATSWTFTRTTAGSSVSVGGAVPFHCTENDGYTSYDVVIMLGRNDLSSSANYNAQNTLNNIQAIINRFAGGRYLVVGTLALASSSDLTTVVQPFNDGLGSTFGANHYYDAQAYLASTAAMSAVGLSPTSTDTTQMGSGFIPDSLATTSDRPHLNANGYTSLGMAIASTTTSLGWQS